MVFNSCDWNDPGHNRYVGTVSAAISRYTDITPSVRNRLITRITLKQYDDIAVISKTGVYGYTGFRDMHFGLKDVCSTVDISKWSASSRQEGLVYCEEKHCIIVPKVCGNVARIDKVVLGKMNLANIPSESLLEGYVVPELADVSTSSAKAGGTSASKSETEVPVLSKPIAAIGGFQPQSAAIGSELLGSSSEISISPYINSLPYIVGHSSPYINSLSYINSSPYIVSNDVPVAPIPEPETYLLMLLGLASIFGKYWLDRRAKSRHNTFIESQNKE